ncbi:MAG: hypothetical protein ABJO01_12105 [Parasphingorhabdus sp.]|uniref:hypothetical protein n=1 Tax=Parasphingorhabdus sp. TaxID=2709688 RepID=UPI003297EBF9
MDLSDSTEAYRLFDARDDDVVKIMMNLGQSSAACMRDGLAKLIIPSPLNSSFTPNFLTLLEHE